jgi:vanillate/4-hydroxybenzoate decarboxylase subunit D
MNVCPRCQTDGAVQDYQGKEEGRVVWTIFRCPTCCFSWRDSEPDSAIGIGTRSRDFAVDARNLDRYPKILR